MQPNDRDVDNIRTTKQGQMYPDRLLGVLTESGTMTLQVVFEEDCK
jgi:hypothetical protein